MSIFYRFSINRISTNRFINRFSFQSFYRLLLLLILLPSLVFAGNTPPSTSGSSASPASDATPTAGTSAHHSMIPAPPELNAKSYYLLDPNSGYVIAEKNIDNRVEPASLTKMMTMYVVDQALASNKIKKTDLVKTSLKARKAQGSRMFIEVNSEVSVDDLIHGVVVQSGNDASISLAEYIGGSEEAFADIMNFYAKELGMNNTHFMNATGLPDDNHYTTARDMATLSRALIRDFPESYTLYSEKEFTYNKIKQPNRNRLLWIHDWVDGIKTGFTETAGYCMVASGKKGKMRLVAIVMGSKTDKARVADANQLLNYGFRFYQSRRIYPADGVVKQARVWMGTQKTLNLGVKDDVYVTIAQGQYDHLKATVEIDRKLKAPIQKGTELGTLAIYLDDKVILERPVVALEEVKTAGFFAQILDWFAMHINALWLKVST